MTRLQTCERISAAQYDVIVVGGGLAGLSAAIYLGRAMRNILVIDSNQSLAGWVPDVENYLGFPDGIAGKELLQRGRRQARRYGARLARDEIINVKRKRNAFTLVGKAKHYTSERVLLATGLYHLPPEIKGVRACLGRSIFFCKDCDGCRVRGKRVLVYGWNNDAVDYALGMRCYSTSVGIVTDSRRPGWDRKHARCLREYQIPFRTEPIHDVAHRGGQLQRLHLPNGDSLEVDALFTTRGDIFHNRLAKLLGAKTDELGQVVVDGRMRTTARGVYAAGCVTPANCQMIIAAGQGALAAQTINRDLFDRCLANHSLAKTFCKTGPVKRKRKSRR